MNPVDGAKPHTQKSGSAKHPATASSPLHGDAGRSSFPGRPAKALPNFLVATGKRLATAIIARVGDRHLADLRARALDSQGTVRVQVANVSEYARR